MFETDPIVAFEAEAIGRKYIFSASLHAMESYYSYSHHLFTTDKDLHFGVYQTEKNHGAPVS